MVYYYFCNSRFIWLNISLVLHLSSFSSFVCELCFHRIHKLLMFFYSMNKYCRVFSFPWTIFYSNVSLFIICFSFFLSFFFFLFISLFPFFFFCLSCSCCVFVYCLNHLFSSYSCLIQASWSRPSAYFHRGFLFLVSMN